jgi:hypothetical protein
MASHHVTTSPRHHVPRVPIQPHLSHNYNIDFDEGKGTDYLYPRPDHAF